MRRHVPIYGLVGGVLITVLSGPSISLVLEHSYEIYGALIARAGLRLGHFDYGNFLPWLRTGVGDSVLLLPARLYGQIQRLYAPEDDGGGGERGGDRAASRATAG